MTSLRGRAHIKIDPKGRLSLPTTFRSALGSTKSVYITNNIFRGRRFLDVYSRAEWEKFEKKIAKFPSLKSEVQAFQRFYVSSAEACEIDSQGRILVPQHLRDYAALESEIVLVGVGNKIEIWQQNSWQQMFGEIETDYERVMNVMADIDASKGKK